MPTLCSLFIEWSALLCFDLLSIMHCSRYMIVLLALMFFKKFLLMFCCLWFWKQNYTIYIYQYAYLLYCTIVVILTTQNVTDLCSFLFYKVWFIKEQCTICNIYNKILPKLYMDLRCTQFFNIFAPILYRT